MNLVRPSGSARSRLPPRLGPPALVLKLPPPCEVVVPGRLPTGRSSRWRARALVFASQGKSRCAFRTFLRKAEASCRSLVASSSRLSRLETKEAASSSAVPSISGTESGSIETHWLPLPLPAGSSNCARGGSGEEAQVVSGLSDPEAAAKWVLARPGARARWCVVKMGAAGALLCERGGAAAAEAGGAHHAAQAAEEAGGSGRREGGSVRTTRVGAVKVDVVDTVGCGDSFAAAVVMGYINSWPADVTLALANAVGGATATGRGAGRNVASADKVLALLAAGAAAGPEVQRAAFARARVELQRSLEGMAAGRGQARALGAVAA
ncbi:hypothetical protein TSOC_006785 [Tetrabaena socialis]|uniref:Carbohydrate kinase PfkB domain-containing protein n=1 Tax=Tetrabaena socialis TaxID=47790 RepID=A0A2J8A2Q0_9CHLO|nr:hypothetical protein TSOC_006785 [Tetrabaena socialis]|eukprot:PNH06801.1 hypothetical protein TSOC_006785 [Tetrabaena socialis]